MVKVNNETWMKDNFLLRRLKIERRDTFITSEIVCHSCMSLNFFLGHFNIARLVMWSQIPEATMIIKNELQL
jgi:hypothetical protein